MHTACFCADGSPYGISCTVLLLMHHVFLLLLVDDNTTEVKL
jgi:hypothetical protein